MTAVEERPAAPAPDSPPAPPPEERAAEDLASLAGSEVAVVTPAQRNVQRMTLNAKLRYVAELSHAELLPAQYRKKPANLLYAVEFGEMVGLSHPLAAVLGVHVIDGKPTASPALMSALVRAAGHRLRVKSWKDEAGQLRAKAWLTRKDDPEFTYEVEWDVDRAVMAELVEVLPDGKLLAVVEKRSGDSDAEHARKRRKSSWTRYPQNMLSHRCIGEVCRLACEDVLLGLNWTPDEFGAFVDENGNVIEGELAGVETGDDAQGTLGPEPEPARWPEPGGALPPEEHVERVRRALWDATTEDQRRGIWRTMMRAAEGPALQLVPVTLPRGELVTFADLLGQAKAAIERGTTLGAAYEAFHAGGDSVGASGTPPEGAAAASGPTGPPDGPPPAPAAGPTRRLRCARCDHPRPWHERETPEGVLPGPCSCGECDGFVNGPANLPPRRDDYRPAPPAGDDTPDGMSERTARAAEEEGERHAREEEADGPRCSECNDPVPAGHSACGDCLAELRAREEEPAPERPAGASREKHGRAVTAIYRTRTTRALDVAMREIEGDPEFSDEQRDNLRRIAAAHRTQKLAAAAPR